MLQVTHYFPLFQGGPPTITGDDRQGNFNTTHNDTFLGKYMKPVQTLPVVSGNVCWSFTLRNLTHVIYRVSFSSENERKKLKISLEKEFDKFLGKYMKPVQTLSVVSYITSSNLNFTPMFKTIQFCKITSMALSGGKQCKTCLSCISNQPLKCEERLEGCMYYASDNKRCTGYVTLVVCHCCYVVLRTKV